MQGQRSFAQTPNFSVATQAKWSIDAIKLAHNGSIAPSAYFDLLSTCAALFSIWETTYYRRLASHAGLIEWVKGTSLRPYLDQLGEEMQRVFLEEILNCTGVQYRAQKNGEMVFLGATHKKVGNLRRMLYAVY